MPLDTGAVTERIDSPHAGGRLADRGPPPSLSDRAGLGDTLRAMRLYRELDLDDLAQVTRIRVNYLAAIEHMRVDQLPARPFALGYVRAYAQALGLDGDLAAARFKVEAPDGSEPLRAPLGVRRESDPRLKVLGAAVGLLAVAFFAWNIAQHLPGDGALAPHARRAGPEVAASAAKPLAAAVAGPLTLGAPLPPPAESTTPTPYITPGLEQAMGPSAAAAAAAAQSAAAQAEPAGSPFVAKGAVYGVPASQSNVVLQARKAASLIVRGADGSVYFARELAPGEAYRAPLLKGLSIEAPDPQKFDVYVGGALKGPLANAKTDASTLATPPAAG